LQSFAATSRQGRERSPSSAKTKDDVMTNDIAKAQTTVPAKYEEEADNLLAATQGHEKLLKFVKGKYKTGDDEVPLGTQYVVHAGQLTYAWVKFIDNKIVERCHGKAADKWIVPEREELGDTDQSQWELVDGKPKDPWCFQRLLPFENMENGEVLVFVTGSVGGEIATNELVKAYAARVKRKGSRALPIIKLASKDMKTRLYGDVPRPFFEIDGWEDAPDGDAKMSAAAELNDAISF
jgi:hypothetical protein